jgi:hypothetical protein
MCRAFCFSISHFALSAPLAPNSLFDLRRQRRKFDLRKDSEQQRGGNYDANDRNTPDAPLA